MNAPSYRLMASAGTGSAIVEAALELAGLDYVIEELEYETLGPNSEPLGKINPLGQVPTLVLPDGRVLTESAAMMLHIADRASAAGLVPPGDAPSRPVFLRWLVFLVAAIYPTFTFGDDPGRWVSGDAAVRELRDTTNRHREALWRYLESEVAPDPWLLGEDFSALDIYIWVMTHWRPRANWFAEHCPKLNAVARATGELPALQAVRKRNFG